MAILKAIGAFFVKIWLDQGNRLGSASFDCRRDLRHHLLIPSITKWVLAHP